MSKLTPELQKQIEREADGRSVGFETKLLASVAKTEYEIGAEAYAEKWQEAEQRAERYEKALFEIQFKATSAIFPHLPVETIGAQMCIEIEKVANEALTPKQTTDERRL